MDGGYEYVKKSTNSAYQNFLQKQDIVKNKEDEIIEKQNELTEVTLKTVDETCFYKSFRMTTCLFKGNINIIFY